MLDFAVMHAKAAIKSNGKDGPKVKYFISGIILGFLVMFYGIISNSSFLIGMGSIVIGIDVVFFPFTTPETTAFWDIKRQN